MPTYTAPGSDDSRLTTLETILSATADGKALASQLPAALRTDIDSFVKLYRPAVQAVGTAMAGRAKEVSEKTTALGSLDTHVRDFFEALKRRTARLAHNIAVLVHYGLPQSGDLPAGLRNPDVLEPTARGIVAGEAAATAAGFPAMVNPSAAEVDTALKAYLKEAAEVSPADEHVRTAQAAAAKHRDRADDLISDVKDEVTHALRKEDPSAQRRVLRQLGFTFTANSGETPEPAPAPAATPTPA